MIITSISSITASNLEINSQNPETHHTGIYGISGLNEIPYFLFVHRTDKITEEINKGFVTSLDHTTFQYWAENLTYYVYQYADEYIELNTTGYLQTPCVGTIYFREFVRTECYLINHNDKHYLSNEDEIFKM